MSITILYKEYDIETITILDLSNQNLTSIPIEICNLKNLEILDLFGNFIKIIPPEIGLLTNLKAIYLNYNELTSIHVEIKNLTKLQKVCLNDNHLTELPTEICNLTSLKELYLENNKLKSLPIEILKIKDSLRIDETSYDIDNMDSEAKILVLTNLKNEITNLPISIKEIWVKDDVDTRLIKIPFGCKVMYF